MTTDYEDRAAIDAARVETETQVRAEERARVAPQLVNPPLRAALAGRVTDDGLTALLSTVDPVRFLTDDGDVDHDRIAAFVAGFAPSGTPSPAVRRFPSLGQGRRGEPSSSRPSVQSGRDRWAARHQRDRR